MFDLHNEGVRKVWSERHRMPMIIAANARLVLLNRELSEGVTFRQYYENPQTMLEIQCRFRDYYRHNIYADHEMGLPAGGWDVNVDFQNDTECGWLGAEVQFAENNVPFTVPFLDDDKKNMLFERGIPGTFDGLMGKIKEYYEYFCTQKANGFTYRDLPLANIGMPGGGTDGPMTLACMLRGTENFCVDLYEDTEYALNLLDFLTEAAILRIKGIRRYFGQPEVTQSFGFADDSIALLSCDDYRELILPYHKKLVAALSDGSGKNGIHLCGDASRHFKTIRDELNVYSFDTGFPIDFAKTVKELGPDVTVMGGVHVHLLQLGSADAVAAETKRIIDEVKPLTRNFIMREANNLAPNTPPENIKAMYDTVLREGEY